MNRRNPILRMTRLLSVDTPGHSTQAGQARAPGPARRTVTPRRKCAEADAGRRARRRDGARREGTAGLTSRGRPTIAPTRAGAQGLSHSRDWSRSGGRRSTGTTRGRSSAPFGACSRIVCRCSGRSRVCRRGTLRPPGGCRSSGPRGGRPSPAGAHARSEAPRTIDDQSPRPLVPGAVRDPCRRTPARHRPDGASQRRERGCAHGCRGSIWSNPSGSTMARRYRVTCTEVPGP